MMQTGRGSARFPACIRETPSAKLRARGTRMVVPKLLENFPCLGTGTLYQSVECFEVCLAPGSDQVVDVG
jgi:hypothetical protein